ncbi:MAG: LysM peptidoglycan-binding domain-containing protein [Christensenellales bacterium]|jgi:LysM repeat protein
MATIIHKVSKGETLYTIGKKYKVPPYIIGRENGVKEIEAGMRLIIPAPMGVKYTVKPFDTVESIATAHNIDYDYLVSYIKTDKVFIGQVIYLPYSGDS